MPDLSRRVIVPELMDTEEVTYGEFQACLPDLETINRLTFAYGPTLSWLSRAVERVRGDRTLTIADIGSGHGDGLRRIWRWAKRRGIAVALTGIDINPWSTRAARAATPMDAPIRYETVGVFDVAPDRRFDFVVSALFAHHLDDDGVVRFLRWMEEHAALGWFVNDIHRHPLPYHFIRHGVRLAGMNRLVRHDAPVSVGRAFIRPDWLKALTAARLDPNGVEIRWHLPFKYGVGRLK
ncbi:MAG TPA: methyltransferase domain-containing protein [Alphaproteobacteria bacterium]|nr:methyltransferase domain-containing protein [Alphaproteobacteria bacterium]